ncbi:MAG TPA: methyltransferase domain-containing protein, partial [Prolixibacteraceae bacterium]
MAEAMILQKYRVQYFICSNCGFVQTEKPYWLSEAYSESIARSDLGLISRNIKVSNISAVMISAFFNSQAEFLDYGGGNGMFVRLMRDKGLNFYWQDLYTQNQFARGFEIKDNVRFELVTAFEVFEHLEDPLVEIEKM